MPPRTRKTEEQPAAATPTPEPTPEQPTTPAAPAPDATPPADDTPPTAAAGPPADLPDGFTYNAAGQQWCPACLPGGLHETATSFACDHGTWS